MYLIIPGVEIEQIEIDNKIDALYEARQLSLKNLDRLVVVVGKLPDQSHEMVAILQNGILEE